jgi:hypothetical protein
VLAVGEKVVPASVSVDVCSGSPRCALVQLSCERKAAKEVQVNDHPQATRKGKNDLKKIRTGRHPIRQLAEHDMTSMRHMHTPPHKQQVVLLVALLTASMRACTTCSQLWSGLDLLAASRATTTVALLSLIRPDYLTRSCM